MYILAFFNYPKGFDSNILLIFSIIFLMINMQCGNWLKVRSKRNCHFLSAMTYFIFLCSWLTWWLLSVLKPSLPCSLCLPWYSSHLQVLHWFYYYIIFELQIEDVQTSRRWDLYTLIKRRVEQIYGRENMIDSNRQYSQGSIVRSWHVKSFVSGIIDSWYETNKQDNWHITSLLVLTWS